MENLFNLHTGTIRRTKVKKKEANTCLLCTKKKGVLVTLTEHIINGKTDMKKGDKKFIHAKCLSNKLAIELPYGFIYGRISVIEDEE